MCLDQIVNSPTRRNAILDKILINRRLIDDYAPAVIGPNFGNADHLTVLLRPVATKSYGVTIKKVFDVRESNTLRFIRKLGNVKWENLYRSSESVQAKCNFLYHCLDEALKEIPYTLIEMSNKDKVWMTPILKHMINCRYQAFRLKNFQLYEGKVKLEISKQSKCGLRR